MRYATSPETPLWAVDRAVGLYEDAFRRDAGLVAFLAATAQALAATTTPAPADRGGPNGQPLRVEDQTSEREGGQRG